MARRSKRSTAARKGWETRRRKAAEREAKAAKRSAAARKGWETRRAKAYSNQSQSSTSHRGASNESSRAEVLLVSDYDPDDYDEDDVELAELYNVHPAEVENLREVLDVEWFDPASAAWDYGRLADYIEDLADELDIDEGEIWETWAQIVYGGTPQVA